MRSEVHGHKNTHFNIVINYARVFVAWRERTAAIRSEAMAVHVKESYYIQSHYMYTDLFGDVGVQCQERSTMKSAIANALQPLKSIDATNDMVTMHFTFSLSNFIYIQNDVFRITWLFRFSNSFNRWDCDRISSI